ncbi:hypothetical protein D3C87_1804400 [compost metagenome]
MVIRNADVLAAGIPAGIILALAGVVADAAEAPILLLGIGLPFRAVIVQRPVSEHFHRLLVQPPVY